MAEEADDTVLIRGIARPSAPRRRRAGWWACAATVLAATVGGVAWQTWPHGQAPRPAVPERAPLPRPATEAEILADAPDQLAAYRFASQPTVVVLQFPTLAEQGRALNRVAALLEKHGFPRDRVLDDGELERRIRAAGAAPETFYYGHDYRARDLQRFFALADEAGTALTEEERRLRGLLLRWGAAPGWTENGALISLVRLHPGAGLDAAARAAILRHELSHGLYFTSPDYAAHARRFWREALTDEDRRAFTAFLAAEGYDTGIADLVANETQAYLMHTRDARYFSAASLGMPERRLAELQALFLSGMPLGWLRDGTPAPALPDSAVNAAGWSARREQ